MNRAASVMVVVAFLVFGFFAVSNVAHADEIKVVGVITKIEVAKEGKSAIVTLKDNETGNLVVVNVTDDLTLDKFNDHRILEGDGIRCKYEVINGKNESKFFKKTAGC